MKNIAVIPARSGSKGLKDKNIMELNGQPLLAYSIIAAKESGLFDEVMVSTDSNRYAEVAVNYGAEVPFLRSVGLSGDHAGSWDVVREVLGSYRMSGRTFDSVCLLQPTSPLRDAGDIVCGYQLMDEKGANTVIGVCEMEHSPLWSSTLPADLSMEGFAKAGVTNRPRQEIPIYYRVNGALYIRKVGTMADERNIYTDKCYAYVMPRERSVDIDLMLDFKVAEAIMLG